MIPRFQEQRAQTPTTDFGSYTNELVGKVSLTCILDHSVASALWRYWKVFLSMARIVPVSSIATGELNAKPCPCPRFAVFFRHFSPSELRRRTKDDLPVLCSRPDSTENDLHEHLRKTMR